MRYHDRPYWRSSWADRLTRGLFDDFEALRDIVRFLSVATAPVAVTTTAPHWLYGHGAGSRGAHYRVLLCRTVTLCVDPKSSSFSIILLLIFGVMRHRMIAALRQIRRCPSYCSSLQPPSRLKAIAASPITL